MTATLSPGRRLLSTLGPFFGLVVVVSLFATMLALKDVSDQRARDGASWAQAAGACPFEGLKAFISVANIKTVLSQTVIVAVGALGMTMIIVSGGIDLSVGSAVALSSVVCATCLLHGAADFAAAAADFCRSNRAHPWPSCAGTPIGRRGTG